MRDEVGDPVVLQSLCLEFGGASVMFFTPLHDPIVQWPRTLPFHGSNTGSNPVRVATLPSGPSASESA